MICTFEKIICAESNLRPVVVFVVAYVVIHVVGCVRYSAAESEVDSYVNL